MKDWQKIYYDEHGKLLEFFNRSPIQKRRYRFKCNPPSKPEHFEELECLIVHFDLNKSLLRRYESVISEESKIACLAHYAERFKYIKTQEIIYRHLLPFYLINPKTTIEKIDKSFL